ncbi:ankyrin [Epithele typhae]|uniref:ankyrin n=1 Tax=Epithele typhae TaxID=378194 RepID=UPI002008B221|nr:ankyrin [Epithele typhae]KAH9932116.1 ankyrin [Epithele typhae]
MASEGASNNERLLAAARSDNEDMLLEVFEEGNFDINAQDGLGNTEPAREATPLHLALRIEDEDLRVAVVESLLDAGADTRIKDKNGETVLDLVDPSDEAVHKLVRKTQAQASMDRGDVADDDDDDDEQGSGSGSDDE